MNPFARLFPFAVSRGAVAVIAAAPQLIRVTKVEAFLPHFDITAGRFRKRDPRATLRTITYTQDSLPLDCYVFGSGGGVFRHIIRHRKLKAWALSAGFRGVNRA